MSESMVEFNRYTKQYEVRYRHYAPMGPLTLLDGETGEPVTDVFSGETPEMHQKALAVESTLRAMDRYL